MNSVKIFHKVDSILQNQIIIDLSALQYNYNFVKKNVGNKKILVIIKANAYGLGAINIAKFFSSLDILGFGVANLYEAKELINAGIKNKIFLMGALPLANKDLQYIINNNIISFVSNFQEAIKLSNIALSLNKYAIIHLKFDTGMNRLGFKKDKLLQVLNIFNLPNLKIDGILSHFATADEKDNEFVKFQFNEFKNILSFFSTYNINFKYKHISNSAAIINYPEFNLDIVRPGIMLYGQLPWVELSCKRPLKRVVNFYSYVTDIKNIKKGESIGYSRNYIAERDFRYAIIPVGYADGFSRNLSNKFEVLIHSRKHLVIGNISMDYMVVKLFDDLNYSIGDKVVLIGKYGNLENTIDYLSKLENKTNYEILCSLSRRINKVYKRIENSDFK